jgi:UDP-GlcNAc:undecaprenyl-phosphate GlcNAc-1-phosphate transferase
LYLIVFGQAFLLSWALTPQIIRLARRSGVLDEVGERKIHRTPKPLLGGIGIFLGFVIVVVMNILAFCLLREADWVRTHLAGTARFYPLLMGALPKLALILAGGFFIHLLGVLDDVFKEKMSYKIKFLVQAVVALAVALGGVRTEFMPGDKLDIMVTALWLIGITNSFNLLDNLDGLTAGISIIAAFIFWTVAVLQGQTFFAFILSALAGACLGFLRYNFHPAKLFMGDSGSLFLGFTFGALTVSGSYVVDTSPSLIPVAMPFLILSIPLYDTFSVMFIRWREKRPLFIGDKRHFSHRLLELGLSHRGTVIFIYLVSLCVGIAAALLPYVTFAGSLLILFQAFLIYTLITILVTRGRRQNQVRSV